MKNKLNVILPAYNEEDNVVKLVEAWEEYEGIIYEKYNLELRIYVVNDGSTDSTRLLAEKLERRYKNFILINHDGNRGLGEALKTAVKYSIKDKNNLKGYLCIMDCDNTHSPKYIIDMLDNVKSPKNSNGADVIIASRYQKGAEVKGLSKYRVLMSEGARFVYSSILKVKNVKDYTCGYRLYTNEILNMTYNYFGEQIIGEKGFTCMAELLYKLYCVGANFKEIPFELRYDFKLGTSKMKIIRTAITSIRLAFRLRKINIIKQKMIIERKCCET